MTRWLVKVVIFAALMMFNQQLYAQSVCENPGDALVMGPSIPAYIPTSREGWLKGRRATVITYVRE